MSRSKVVKFMSVAALSVVALVALVGILPVAAQEATPVPQFPGNQSDFPAHTITVTGFGTAAGEPDTAFIELGVEVTNEDVAQAYAEASTTMQAVTQALIDLGIDPVNIRTSSVNVYPQDQYDPQTGAPTARTYRVSSTLRVKVTDVTMVEGVINAAVGAGANTIYSFNFAIEDVGTLEEQARTSAVENARSRAEQLAAALGVTVGEPLVITESYGNQGPIPLPYGGELYSRMDMAQSLPVSAGQMDVTVQILVTFAIS